MAMQVFYWGVQSHASKDRTYYKSFCLNKVTYELGDCVFLFPETPSAPHYIGQIVSAYIDTRSQVPDPHCIEVKWFERRANLEPRLKGDREAEREVVELEEIDVNPIGCISGKATVIKARSVDEATRRAGPAGGGWFFCRGVYRQQSNALVLYDEFDADRAVPEDMADSEEVRRSRRETAGTHSTALKRNRPSDQSVSCSLGAHQSSQEQHLITPMPAGAGLGAAALVDSLQSPDELAALHDSDEQAAKRRAAGRMCLECGATTTPQWREGPQGPKTLCNACGVRYCRAQQRANKGGKSRDGDRSGKGGFGARGVGVTGVGAAGAAQLAAAAASALRQGGHPGTRGSTFRSSPLGAGGGMQNKLACGLEAMPSMMALPAEVGVGAAVVGGDGAMTPGAAAQLSGQRRPMRQAAVIAASKTAAFARTGAFPMSPDAKLAAAAAAGIVLPGCVAATAALALHAGASPASTVGTPNRADHGASRDSSHVSSDSHEEVTGRRPLAATGGGGAQQLPQGVTMLGARPVARTFASPIKSPPPPPPPLMPAAAAAATAAAGTDDLLLPTHSGAEDLVHMKLEELYHGGGGGAGAAADMDAVLHHPLHDVLAPPALFASPIKGVVGTASRGGLGATPPAASRLLAELRQELTDMVGEVKGLQTRLPAEAQQQLAAMAAAAEASLQEVQVAAVAAADAAQPAAARQAMAAAAQRGATSALGSLRTQMSSLMQLYSEVGAAAATVDFMTAA